MITEIVEISDLGIFGNCRPINLPKCKRVNIIYGSNGSGKTTFSKLFSSLNSGSNDEYPDLKYKIVINGSTISQKQLINTPIRVFNQKFVDDNLDMAQCRANPIFILGKENLALNDQIKVDEAVLEGDPDTGIVGKKRELEILRQRIHDNTQERGKVFTDVARTIFTSLQGSALRNYTKTNAESDFYLLTRPHILDDQTLLLKLKHVNENIGYTIENIPQFSNGSEIDKLLNNVDLLLAQTISNQLIDRLVQNPTLSSWVETGLILHQDHESKTCEFCGNILSSNRLAELLGHFNQEDKQLKVELSSLLISSNSIQERLRKLTPESEAKFYSSLRVRYLEQVRIINQEKDALLSTFDKLILEIEQKKQNSSEAIKRSESLDTMAFSRVLIEINKLIDENNNITDSYSEIQKNTRNEIKNHYLSEISTQINKFDEQIRQISEQIRLLTDGDGTEEGFVGINKLEEKIVINKQKISSSGPACEELNNQLSIFLGRKDLSFKHTDEGYQLSRYENPAKNLSEGEKTAIAFVYFTIQLKDKDFDPQRGIVVIDDPISSLDANSLYQAFSFLKANVEGIRQTFILTHNFDFLQLLLSWRKYSENKHLTSYFMINTKEVDGQREANIECLDRMLIDYQTEYQYLFKKLYTFHADGTLGQVYSMPNEARKLLDSFLAIAIPTSESPYMKLQKIKGFPESKRSHIYKFTNDQSHITGKGFDVSLLEETPVVIKELLELIECVLPDHFNYLVDTVCG